VSWKWADVVRTASAVLPTSWPETAFHCVPKVRTARRTTLSSASVHPALLCEDEAILSVSSSSVPLSSLNERLVSPMYRVRPVEPGRAHSGLLDASRAYGAGLPTHDGAVFIFLREGGTAPPMASGRSRGRSRRARRIGVLRAKRCAARRTAVASERRLH